MTRAQALAAYFREHPGQWLDGRDLATVAGNYAWRTRISDLRKPPFRMPIENRQRRLSGGAIVSEYRLPVVQEVKPREQRRDAEGDVTPLLF
jgi:hypothetical protein